MAVTVKVSRYQQLSSTLVLTFHGFPCRQELPSTVATVLAMMLVRVSACPAVSCQPELSDRTIAGGIDVKYAVIGIAVANG